MNKRVELRNTNFIKTMMMFAVVVYHSCALWNQGGGLIKDLQKIRFCLQHLPLG